MKLWEIGWETDEGRELLETIAAEEMSEEIARKYILDTYRELWSDPEMDDNDVYNVIFGEIATIGAIGTDKQFKINLTEI